MKLVRMSTRGRVMIPGKLREELELNPRDRVVFTNTDKGLVLHPLRGNVEDLKGSEEGGIEQDFERV